MANEKLTDADLMTGFNPDPSTPAEEIEAREAGEAVEGTGTEGEGAEAPTTESVTLGADTREVTLDGRTFKAPRDIADAFTREINRRDGTRGAELQGLRERLARLEGASTKPATEERAEDQGPPLPDPELQIENPAEYQKQLIAHVSHRQEVRAQALAQQYEEAEAAKDRETARKAAWQTHVDSFYSKPENEVLRANKDIVDLVLEKHREELAPLSVEEGFDRLSTLAKQRLSQLTGQAPEIKARTTPRPPTLEGSSRRGSVATPAAEPAGPKSLTAALKERRRAAAAAFNKGGTPRTVSSR